MNKRQKKKKEKKYIPIIADEFNLLTMTTEEREKAFIDYKKFREKCAYCKKYKYLKEGETLRYYYPIGTQFANAIKEVSNIARGRNSKFITQSLDDLQNT